MPAPLTAVRLVADKVTKGTVRFTEPEATIAERPLSIYLPLEVVESLGLEASADTEITLTIGT